MLQKGVSHNETGAGVDDTNRQNLGLQANCLGTWTRADELEAGIPNSTLGPYIRGSYLGSGGWSDAYKIMRTSDGEVFAGKFSKARAKLREEASILRSLNHERVLRFVDYYENTTSLVTTVLVMEVCLGGNLQNQMDHFPQDTRREEALQVLRQIAEALDYLHGKNLLHTDVKPRNILIRTWSPVDVVLADCADIKTPRQFTKVTGTPAYYSPQILKTNRNSGFGDDVWALGITFMGLLAQWPPVYRKKNDVKKYPRRCFDHAEKLKAMNPGHDLVGILSRMLAWEADSRASALECVRLASESLDNYTARDDSGFGIETPDDFKPISFW